MKVAGRLLRWGRHYQLGIKQIDLQHEQLIDLLNQLNAAFQAGDPRSSLAAILADLTAAVTGHFQAEEELMKQHGYEGYDLHKAEHDSLAAQVLDFQRNFEAGRAELSATMMRFLADWLRNHVIVADKRMGEFMRARLSAR